MPPDKTADRIHDICTKSGLRKVFTYDGFSWFSESVLCNSIENYLKNKKKCSSTFKKDTPNFILKFAKYYFTSRAITRFVISKIIKKRGVENTISHKILAVSYTSYWKNYPTLQRENKRINQDAMLGDILTALQKKNLNVVAMDDDTTFFVDFKTMVEKRIQGKGLWRPVEFYLTWDLIKKAFRATKKYKKEWDNFKNNKEFTKSFSSNSNLLSTLLRDYFEKLFKYRTFSPVLDIELVKRAIEVESPDLVLITCGYCLLGRAAMIAGKLKGVPTLEIQHGVIHPYHPGYMYAKDEISPNGSVKSPSCPITDITAVYGSYHKELLTKMSVYLEDSVVVTGQPRYDFLGHADQIYSKEKFLSDYRIDQNHKIILWTTQCHGLSEEENVKNFEVVFDTMKNLEDITLVIKQHPNEGKGYTKMIQKYLNSYKMNAVVMPKDSDTYEQLFVCDLMMTRHSTTAMEAVALNKPVIILNLSGEPDPVEYVREGVALGVYDEEDLKPAIEKLLKDDSELAKNRERYIEKYLYKIDGKATERVVNLIEETINDREKRGEK